MPYQSANALLVNKCSGARFIRDVVISLSRRQPHCGQRESDKPFALRSVSIPSRRATFDCCWRTWYICTSSALDRGSETQIGHIEYEDLHLAKNSTELKDCSALWNADSSKESFKGELEEQKNQAGTWYEHASSSIQIEDPTYCASSMPWVAAGVASNPCPLYYQTAGMMYTRFLESLGKFASSRRKTSLSRCTCTEGSRSRGEVWRLI